MDYEPDSKSAASSPLQQDWLAQFATAERFFACGAIADAELAYLSVIEANPEYIGAYVGASSCARKRGDRGASLDFFMTAFQVTPNDLWLRSEVAADLRELGRLDEAEAVYREVVAREPNIVSGHIGLGLCARGRGDRITALGYFQTAAQLSPTDPWPRLEAAHELRELGRPAEAEVIWLEILKISPDNALAHMGLGLCARKRRDHITALGYFQTATQLSPADPWPRLEAANELRDLGRLDEAEAIWLEILKTSPDNAAAHVGLGQCARERRDQITALGYFQTAARLSPMDPWSHWEVANELRELGRLGEAEAVCLEILKISPDNAMAYIGLGLCARKRRDHTTALGHFQTAAQSSPADPWPHLEAANELRELGRLAEAEVIWLEILKISPDNALAHIGLGLCARERGDRIAGLGYFQTAAHLSPTDPWPRLEAANELRDLGRLDEAEAIWLEILKTSPDNATAHVGLGRCAHERRDQIAALGYFQTAAQLSPMDPWSHWEVANELRELGRLDEAETVCLEILKISPDNAVAYIGLGLCARKRGDRATSLALFRSAVKIDPTAPWAHLEAAADLRELGRFDHAEAEYSEVIAIAPENVQARIGLGYCARARGDRAAALAHFDAAAGAAPSDVWSRLEIATEQREASDMDAARQTVLAILEQHPFHWEAMQSLGQIERAAGLYQDALAAFEAAHVAHPEQAQILVEMAMDERQLGQQENCDKYLAQALELDPRNVTAIARRAEQAMIAGDVEQAYEYYRQAAIDQPWELTFQLGIVDALAGMGKADDAIARLLSLEESCGTLPNLRAKRINLLRQSGQYYAALELGRAATQETPYHFWLWIERFYAEMFVGDAEHIEVCLRDMPAGSVPEKATVERFKGNWAESRWQIEDAVRHYEIAAAMYPKDSGIQYDLIRTKFLLLDLEGVRAHLRQSCEMNAQYAKLRGASLNISQTYYGQLLDDYCLDQEMITALAQSLPLPPTARAAALLTAVRGNPDNTAAAVSLMVALRQSGALLDQDRRIPKVIVQFWDSDDLPEDVAKILQTWPEQNPDYVVQRYNDELTQAWLAAHYPAPIVLAYRRVREPAQKADIFRLAWLVAEGGIYVDADHRCLKPLKTIIPENAELVLYQEDFGTLGNSFIAASPKHPVLERALQLAVDAINRGDTDIVWLSTGPALLTRAFAQVLVEYGWTNIPKVVVLDRRDLFQAIGKHCSAQYKKTE